MCLGENGRVKEDLIIPVYPGHSRPSKMYDAGRPHWDAAAAKHCEDDWCQEDPGYW